jgi:adenylate cyclase
MKITLLVEGVKHPLDLSEDGITIGRGDAADLRITSNAVSRVHARFLSRNGRVWVTDLKSLNGTSLNGLPVAEGAELKPGDTVLLGEVPVQWLVEEAPVPQAAATPPLPAALATGRGSTEAKIALEDRAFDASGSILVPHASLEAMLAKHQAESAPAVVDSLFQRLAAMAGKLLRAADLAELLDSVMGLVTGQIRCQRGFILLSNPAGELVPEYVWEEKPGQITMPISRTIARVAMTNQVTILTTDARVDPRFAAGESIKIHGISSALCAPLIVDDQALGVVYLESSLSKGGFRPEDEHLLSAMANFAAVGIQREREAKFRQRLERYHSPQVVGEILRAAQNLDAPLLQARRCEISVLFADISGFTRMSEGMEPLQLASILNRSFEVMTEQIFLHGGTLDKYIGDAIMAFFGAPAPDPEHARHAVAAAVAMQRQLKAMNDARPEGYPELKMRIGINSGEAFAGDIGCEKRMDYTVMGSTVNLASRLESGVARPGQIVAGPRTAELIGKDGLRAVQAVSLKGIEHEVLPFEVPWEPERPFP